MRRLTECEGEITSVSQNYQSGHTVLTLSVWRIPERELLEMKQTGRLTVTLKKYRKKRSLDANAYYWQLITDLAEVLGISKPRCHNEMLRSYGQRLFIDGKAVRIPIPDTEKAYNTALEAHEYHIKPTSQVKEGTDGLMYRTYVMLKGSSEYDTKEMSALIDGLVSDCKEAGIETLPPDKLAAMMRDYSTG